MSGPPLSAPILIGVACMGAVGALARLLMGVALSRAVPGAPATATLLINLSGCAALGLLTGLAELGAVPPTVRLPLAAGLLGSFTTFSTLSVEAVELLSGENSVRGVMYIATSLIGGLGLAAAGLALGRGLRAGL